MANQHNHKRQLNDVAFPEQGFINLWKLNFSIRYTNIVQHIRFYRRAIQKNTKDSSYNINDKS